MDDVLKEALAAIERQQPKEHTTVWGVGEQLKEILYYEPQLAGLVLADIGKKGMGLADCEKQIKARADEIHKTAKGSGVCVTPMEAEGIIRKFYGLPEKSSEIRVQRSERAEVIELADFF